MANYYISAVYKNSLGVISHLIIHAESNAEYGGTKFRILKGEKKSESEVITLINKGHSCKVILWDYRSQLWIAKEKVNVVIDGENTYLRTTADKSLADNLDNLMTGAIFI